ncbi:two-component system CitB family sensor kinase [Microbacterium testaceum]|uniref:ATP-binding protein n=1 Tax=Microbacterium testaceum TaxID=2033 RepID=UPI002785D86A|nr:ATP-binding protein [Microbacterium testaceum]MDQ1172511.1 two-component system CitB family sensor kinase [Microbacterium testaceum]
MREFSMALTPRAARRVLVVLPSVIVLFAVGLTTVIAASVQERRIRDDTVERVFDVASGLAELDDVRTAAASVSRAGTAEDLADAEDLAPATTVLQPLADLVERTTGVFYVVITDDEGVRITHPEAAQRGVLVETANASVLAGTPFVGIETGPSGSTVRAKVPISSDGTIVGMVAVGVLESRMLSDRDEALGALLPWALGALVIGTLASSLLAAAIERRFRQADALAAEQEQTTRTMAALREQAHEFGTRLHVLHGLVSHGDTRDALAYIADAAPTLTARPASDARLGPSVVGASLEALRAEVGALGAHLEVQVDRDLPVDETVLVVLANLCRNAAEAGASRVRCTLSQVGDLLHGAVDDDGPGLDARDVERAFSVGHSSKPDVTGTGRGLGLGLVRRAVAERGGEVTVSRSAWGGASFSFEMAVPR